MRATRFGKLDFEEYCLDLPISLVVRDDDPRAALKMISSSHRHLLQSFPTHRRRWECWKLGWCALVAYREGHNELAARYWMRELAVSSGDLFRRANLLARLLDVLPPEKRLVRRRVLHEWLGTMARRPMSALQYPAPDAVVAALQGPEGATRRPKSARTSRASSRRR